MIKRLATSIVKKNSSIPIFGIGINNLKLIHLFSNDKKNPFDKFKRSNNTPKNTDKHKSQQQKNHQQKSQEKNDNIHNYNQNNKQNEPSASNQHRKRPAAGFDKFKRIIHEENKTKITSKNPKKQSKTHSTEQKDNKTFSKSQQSDKVSSQQPIIKSTKNSQTPKTSKPLEIKGFNKFKKISQNKEKQNIQGVQQQMENKKLQDMMNSFDKQEKEKQNIYKNTEKKIQEDKEEWQRFLQEQIKKAKEQQQNKKKSQIWRNFEMPKRMNLNQKGSDQQGRGGASNQNPYDMQRIMKLLFFGGVGMYLASGFIADLLSYDRSKTIQTTELVEHLHQGQIRETWFLTIVESLSQESSRTKKYACVTLNSGQILKCQSNNDFEIEWNKLVDQYNTQVAMFRPDSQPIIKKVPIIKRDNHIFNTIRSILSFALLFMFLRSLMSGVSKGKAQMGKGGGGLSGLFENTKSHRFRQNVNVKFDDVMGMNKAKQQIVQFIDFLKNAQKYNKLGAKIPRGALLTGPPGTGKTMLAKACAGQSGVPFFTISGSQFMEMYVGVGAQRVRNLFSEAKQSSPSIIFIDEIDAVGKKRASGVGGGGNDERDNTLNQLLVEMDGFDQTTNVIVFAATNQKEVLDPALTRPGRFDRLIEVDLPDIEGRKEIFMVHLKPLTLDEKYDMEVYAKRLATLTPGFSGADIKNLCNQAAIIAARNQKSSVSMIDFELASERIIGGVQKKSTLITPQTRKTVAYHQCGHGVVSWFMQHASPLLKLTIIPRSKGALGYAQYLPSENNVYTRKQLEDQICVILGGRITEEIFFGKISTGASDDLQKAHKVAKSIIAEYGMGKKLSWLSYGETQYAKQYSHQTQQKIDQQILQIVQECSKRTREIITQKKELIEKLAQLLLKEQTIDQRMIQGILGQRPFKTSKQYEQYIRERQKMIEDEQKDKKQKQQAAGSTAAFKGIYNLTLINTLKGQTKKLTKSNRLEMIDNS